MSGTDKLDVDKLDIVIRHADGKVVADVAPGPGDSHGGLK